MEVMKPEALAALVGTLSRIDDCLQRAKDGFEGMLGHRPRADYVGRQVDFAHDLVATAESQLREALGEEGWMDLNVYIATGIGG